MSDGDRGLLSRSHPSKFLSRVWRRRPDLNLLSLPGTRYLLWSLELPAETDTVRGSMTALLVALLAPFRSSVDRHARHGRALAPARVRALLVVEIKAQPGGPTAGGRRHPGADPTFALCRGLLRFAALCCIERARKGQPPAKSLRIRRSQP